MNPEERVNFCFLLAKDSIEKNGPQHWILGALNRHTGSTARLLLVAATAEGNYRTRSLPVELPSAYCTITKGNQVIPAEPAWSHRGRKNMLVGINLAQTPNCGGWSHRLWLVGMKRKWRDSEKERWGQRGNKGQSETKWENISNQNNHVGSLTSSSKICKTFRFQQFFAASFILALERVCAASGKKKEKRKKKEEEEKYQNKLPAV